MGEGCVVWTNGTVTRGDLLEPVLVSGQYRRFQQYQTAGKPPSGVAYYDATTDASWPGSRPSMAGTIIQNGIARINVNSGNTIAAMKYVKPDASHAGCVVEASSFSDGPIVGYTEIGHEDTSDSRYGTNSTRSVLVRLA